MKGLPIPAPVGDGLIKMIIGNQLPGALSSLKEHCDLRDLTKPIARETPVGIFCFGKMSPDDGPEKSAEDGGAAAQIHMFKGLTHTAIRQVQNRSLQTGEKNMKTLIQ